MNSTLFVRNFNFKKHFSLQINGNGILYQFNPINGAPIDGGVIELNYPIRQMAVLQPGADFLRGILLLDKNNNVHVFPESAAETVSVAAPNTIVFYFRNFTLKEM